MSAALPDEVAAARRGLDQALAESGAPSSPAASSDEPPAVAVVGAPGRGRRALVGALLDLEPDPGRDRFTAAPDGVPLLEELDLLLPRRTRDGGWDSGAASMLLVVAGAGAPLDRDELARLAAVAGQVETVVFALVGTEAHRGWRTVLEADRDLVAEHVPRLADAEWFPVSPVLARAARGTGPEGEARRRAAGIAPLQRRLHQLVARRRRMLDEANALRAGVTALSGARSTPGAADLRRRRAELETARTSLRREHHVRWRAELAGARLAAVDDLGRRIRVLGARHREHIDTASRAELADLGPQVARDLTAVADTVLADLADRLRGLVDGTLAGLLSPAELARLRLPAPEARPDVPVPAPRAPDRLLVVAGASGGLGLSRLALLPLLAVPVAPVVGAALVPVSVGIGLGAATWLARARRRAAERAHARTWLAEALGQARTDLERVLVDALIVADREITLALDRALDERGRALDAELSALAEEVRRDRESSVRAAEAVARAEAVLARLALVRDTT